MSHLQYILLAEDDIQYAFIIQLALKQAGIENPVHLLTSHDHLIAYLAGEGPYADRAAHPLPAVLILALRLPLFEDFRALRWIRQRRDFDHIRIAVLSSVDHPSERETARQFGADTHLIKPSDFSGLVRIAEDLRRKWLEPPSRQLAA